MTQRDSSILDVQRKHALERLAFLNKARGPAVSDFWQQVKDVVIVASSSRGGSSIFTEILRQSSELIHFRAEVNPFFVLAGLTYSQNGFQSDVLDEAHAQPYYREHLAILEREMSLDAGITMKGACLDFATFQRFRHDFAWRILIQWPQIPLTIDLLYSLIEETFAELYQSKGWKEGEFKDTQLFHVIFLQKLRSHYPQVNPYYYDLNPGLIKAYFPGLQPCYHPPSSFMIEEPPFVTISPWRRIPEEKLKNYPLVIKTPSNVYRFSFLRKIFPKARLRILHLVRNPAAAINGLYDGWRYHGFFSHRVSRPLNMVGYSDHFPEWATHWWKFDLPPGWEDWTAQPLEKVCAFQWRCAHEAILNFLETQSVEAFRISFEDVLGPLEVRRERFKDLAEWLGVSAEPLLDTICGEMPMVMATSQPRQRRWFQKVKLLAPLFSSPPIQEMTYRLGYELDQEKWM
jgi:hypothetical protein